MEKIDLCTAIIERFKIANNNNVELERLNTLFRYFIKDNIDSLFGKSLFDQDELEVVRVKDGLVIDSIFGIRLNIDMSHDGDFRIVATDAETGKIFFSIFMSDTIAINECFVDDHSYKYEINIAEDKFAYTEYGSDKEESFSAYLQPLGAKRNRFEIFEFKKTVPEETGTKTFLEKVAGRINGDGFVRIETGYALKDVVNHAEVIFDTLKKEAKKEKGNTKKLKNQGN